LIVVDGKSVFSDLSELVDPSHTALLVIDMQCDFVEENGVFADMGINLSMYGEAKPKMKNLLHIARQEGVLVIHLKNTALPDRMSDSPAQIRFNLKMHNGFRGSAPSLQYTVPGTPGFDFAPGFEPLAGELVVQKFRSSGFWGTNLDMILRSNGIKTVVVTGCTTEGCVESTARDAMFSDYFVVIAEDCVASDDREQHEASLLLMKHRFDLANGSAIEKIWEQSQSHSEGE